MKGKFFHEPKRWRSALILLGCYLGVLLIGYVDLKTGFEFSFSIFYLIPIMVAVWRGKKWAALVLSIFSAMVIAFVDLSSGQSYLNAFASSWNMLIHLGFFVLVVVLGSGYKKELEKQRNLARTDPLTGVANTRYFNERGTVEIERAGRFKRPISLAYVDVDDFKKVNDTFGHERGDVLLTCLAGIVRKRVRAYDLVARIGGDEFVVLLPETPANHARVIGNKIRDSMSECGPRCGISVTFSIGVATYMTPPPSIHDLIKAADDLMYKAKASGKNAVECRVFGT
jgi:diguanylate cyclase (GGDEF)-like protein